MPVYVCPLCNTRVYTRYCPDCGSAGVWEDGDEYLDGLEQAALDAVSLDLEQIIWDEDRDARLPDGWTFDDE